MARATFGFFDKQEIARIHDVSIRALEKVGVLVHSEPVTRLLLDGGAARSKDGRRVLIPESVVKEGLAAAPKSVLLASRDGKNDIRIPAQDRMFAANGGEGVYIKDMTTGASRPADSRDLADFAYLVDRLPQVDFFWPMVGALEEPVSRKGMVELKTSYQFTKKHVQAMATSTEEAVQMAELSKIFSGSDKDLAKRPIFSAVECPISPLTFEEGLVEAQVELAKHGIPVVAMSASVAGLTSPVTLAGTVAQINAENLASLVISQMAMKGAPFIYSSDSCPGDLQSGSIDYGAIEASLVRTGAGQMGRQYGLPTMVCGIGLENLSADVGDAWDGVHYMISQGIVPSDLASGFGGVDQATGASFEQLLADAWVWEIAREFIRPFDTTDEALAFDVIRDAGIDGNFLGKRHTITRFRKESAATRFPAASLAGRKAERRKGALIRKAKDEAERMLKEKAPAVSKDELRQMDDLLRTIT